MKKTKIVVMALLALALAPALAAAQQGPPAVRGQGWRQGAVPRALMRRAPFAGRMGWQGWMAAAPGRGLGMRGQAWGPGFQAQGLGPLQAPGFRGRMLPGGVMGMRGQLAPLGQLRGGMGMRGQLAPLGQLRGGMGMRGQLAPLGPLGNPQIREQLNLSEAQVKQLEELRASLQQERQQEQEQLRGERQQLTEQLRAERQKQQEQDRADRQKLMEQLRGSNEKLMQQRQQRQEQMQERLQQLLTPEQREKLQQLEAERPMGRGMVPGMRRGLIRPDSVR